MVYFDTNFLLFFTRFCFRYLIWFVLFQIGSLKGYYLLSHHEVHKRSTEPSHEHHRKLNDEPQVSKVKWTHLCTYSYYDFEYHLCLAVVFSPNDLLLSTRIASHEARRRLSRWLLHAFKNCLSEITFRIWIFYAVSYVPVLNNRSASKQN